MKKGWDFPNNNNGQVCGISEAGIETFKGSPIPSLAREICQNSLDARYDFSKPVTVEFSLFDVSISQIDKFGELKNAIHLCKKFWEENNNAKTVKFFSNACRVIENSSIRVLKISDYNTTGLTGSNGKYNTPWQNLVKSSGVSDKSGSSGGSFGIGKSAPFVCSDIRTVLYSTLDVDGIKASQGVARLVSFEKDIFMRKSYITQGIGYYGNVEDNSAINELISFNNITRTQVGTDVYILGFINSQSWVDDIIIAILDGFLISIINSDLEVRIANKIINVKTIYDYIEEYKDKAQLTYNYYQVLTSKNTVCFTEYFKDLGNVTLQILLNSEFKRKVLVTRKNGMKILDKNNISGSIYFAGVLVLEDEKINAYFREMETPQHDDWQPDRHSNPTQAKKYKSELFRWVKSKVTEVGYEVSTDESDVEGLGDYLPDETLLSETFNKDNTIETLKNKTKNIDITLIKKVTAKKGNQHIESNYIEGDVEVPGFFDEDLNDGETFIDVGEANDSTGVKGSLVSGREDANGNNIIHKTTSIKPISIRLYMSNYKKKQYTLIFSPESTAQQSYIQLSVSGEQSSIKIPIKKAFLTSTPSVYLNTRSNKILIGDVISKTKVSINFEIDYDDACSMEVNLYGIKI